MKILLISSNITESPYPIYPLGLSIIASALTRAGHEVRQFDFLRNSASFDRIKEIITEFQPDLTGISIRNIDNVNLMNNQFYIDTVRDIVSAIRSVSDRKVLLGGAGFSLMPELIMERTGADFGIVGEGELQMVRFADRAANNDYPEEPLISSSTKLSGQDFVPALYDDDLINFYRQSGQIASIQTKRGCASKCIYCSYPVLEGSTIRRRPVPSVVSDIELLSGRHGLKYLFFVDSVFNDDEGAYLELIDEMVKREIDVPWTGYFKPTGLTDDIVSKMKRTGLTDVEIGADAACDSTLKTLRKGFTFNDLRSATELFSRHGISVAHFYMFGGPGETRETVQEGIENILSLEGCIVFIFMGIRILPGTPLANIAIKEGIIAGKADLLKPVYYLSPLIEKEWLEGILKESFADRENCIFPPDTYDSISKSLHKMGQPGTLWSLLLGRNRRRSRKGHVSG